MPAEMRPGSSCNPADLLRNQGIHLRDFDQAVDFEVLSEHGIGKTTRSAVVDGLDPVAGERGRIREPAHRVAFRLRAEDLCVRLVDRADQRVILRDLGARGSDVNLRLDLVVGEPLTQITGEVAQLGTRFGHRHRRWDAEVDEEVGPMRCPRNAPGDATADRPDVDDTSLPSIRRSLLPFRCELQNGTEHITHSYDRILVSPTLAERAMDERSARRDPHPERAVVTQDDLLLGWLAEDAHV